MKNRAPNISKRRVGNGEACMPTAWLQLCSFAVVGSLLPLLLGRQHHSVVSTPASSTVAQKSQSAEPGCLAACVAEPPELSRLKCVGHHHNGNTGSKRTSNGTILGLSGNVPIQPPVLVSNKHTPHEGESRDITTIHIL